MIISVLIILVAQLFSVQGDVEVILKYAELPVYEKEYLTEPDVYVYDDGKIFLNFSIIKEFPPTAEVHQSLIGASMGEYIVDLGLEVQVPLCEMADYGLELIMIVFGFTKDNCPPKPGVYGNQAFVFSGDKFSDNFPPNQYKSILEITNKDEKIMMFNLYFNVQ